MMRLSARVRANRLNARKSTGPKSAAGKARSAQNARRHGLAIPVSALPELVASFEELAREISGPYPSDECLSAARAFAAGTIDLARIRQARVVLLTDPKVRIVEPTADDMLRGMRDVAKLVPTFIEGLDAVPSPELSDRDLARLGRMKRLLMMIELAEHPPSLIESLATVLPKLQRLDRYEQRAYARRKKAAAALLAHSEELSVNLAPSVED